MSAAGRWQVQAVAFLAVGLLSFVADLGTLWGLHAHGVPLVPATVAGLAAGFLVNFTLNRRHVFGSDAAVGGQLVRYWVLSGANFAVTVVLVPSLAAAGVDYRVAKTVTVALLAVVNFVFYRRWVFT